MRDGEIKGSGTPEEVLREKFLKEIYDVDVKVLKDKESDSIHILYKPDRMCQGKGGLV